MFKLFLPQVHFGLSTLQPSSGTAHIWQPSQQIIKAFMTVLKACDGCVEKFQYKQIQYFQKK